MIRGYYETLGVSEDATPEEIQRAYKRAASRTHPDKNPGREKEAAEEFKDVKLAYECLIDPERRQHYDETGESDQGEEDPAEALFIHLVQSIVEKVETVDEILQAMAIILKDMVTEATNQRGQKRKELATTERMCKSVKYKGTGINLIEGILTERVERIKADIAELDRALDAASKVQEELREYQATDKAKPRRQRSANEQALAEFQSLLSGAFQSGRPPGW